MAAWIDAALVLLILTNLVLVGTSRISACIRLVAVQGIMLALLTAAAYQEGLTVSATLLAMMSVVLKGVVFPALLFRAMRNAQVRREIEPFVGYAASLAIGTVALAAALWFSSRLPLPAAHLSHLAVPAAFHSMLIGLLLIVSRKKAITQVLGYLVLENGIHSFGIATLHESPVLVELGVLLDVFVAVFVMGIAIFRISREFDHIDTDRLAALRD